MEKKMFEVTTEMTEDEKLNVFYQDTLRESIRPYIKVGRKAVLNTFSISSVYLVLSTLNVIFKFIYCLIFWEKVESMKWHK